MNLKNQKRKKKEKGTFKIHFIFVLIQSAWALLGSLNWDPNFYG